MILHLFTSVIFLRPSPHCFYFLFIQLIFPKSIRIPPLEIQLTVSAPLMGYHYYFQPSTAQFLLPGSQMLPDCLIRPVQQLGIFTASFKGTETKPAHFYRPFRAEYSCLAGAVNIYAIE